MNHQHLSSLGWACSLAAVATFSTVNGAIAAIFAGEVIEYRPGSGVGWEYDNVDNTLGAPDYRRRCRGCGYASLGNGGSLTVGFSGYDLTGSGDERPDLEIREIGPLFETTLVSVSLDGKEWFDLGKTSDQHGRFDLDALGFGLDARFAFVKIADELGESGKHGPYAGADIDAISAISTVKRSTPEPRSWLALALLGLLSGWRLGWQRR